MESEGIEAMIINVYGTRQECQYSKKTGIQPKQIGNIHRTCRMASVRTTSQAITTKESSTERIKDVMSFEHSRNLL